jgi:hypothetical protein
MKLFLEKGTLSSNKLEGFSDQPRANVIKLSKLRQRLSLVSLSSLA